MENIINHISIVIYRLVVIFLFPIFPYFNFIKKRKSEGLAIFLSILLILVSILYLITILRPEYMYYGGTWIMIILEYVFLHLGLFLLQSKIVFLLTSAYLAISLLIGYGNLIFNLKHYFKYVFNKQDQ